MVITGAHLVCNQRARVRLPLSPLWSNGERVNALENIPVELCRRSPSDECRFVGNADRQVKAPIYASLLAGSSPASISRLVRNAGRTTSICFDTKSLFDPCRTTFFKASMLTILTIIAYMIASSYLVGCYTIAAFWILRGFGEKYWNTTRCLVWSAVWLFSPIIIPLFIVFVLLYGFPPAA